MNRFRRPPHKPLLQDRAMLATRKSNGSTAMRILNAKKEHINQHPHSPPLPHSGDKMSIQRNVSGMVMAGSYTARLHKSSGPIALEAGQTAEVWVEFQNMGKETWNEYTRLGVDSPRDHSSIIATHTWINTARPAILQQKTVGPGEIGRFSFTIQAPLTSRGTFIEHFAMVQENVTWFDKIQNSTWNLEIRMKRSSSSPQLKILYLSCHETLEHSELTLLSKLGFNVFPVGFYSLPTPIHPTREGTFNIDPHLQEKFIHYFGKIHKPGGPIKLNQDFVDEFDIIINCHWVENLESNMQFFKNKEVIWRTIGLSNASPEQKVSRLKNQMPLKIIRMTPGEPSTAGRDALIRSHIDPDYFNGWVGDEEYVLTVQKWTRLGEVGRLANEYQEVTKNFKRKLCGRDNRGFDCIIDNPTAAELLEMRRRARVYFSLATKNAVNTYTFFEAMMTGMPVVSVGKKLAQTPWFENPSWIENGVSGFVSDDTQELKHYISLLMKDYELAKKLGANARKSVMEVFSPAVILEDWKKFFQREYNITITEQL